MMQAAPAAGRPWETAPGLQVGSEAWTGGRPQAAVAQHHQGHDSAHDCQSTSGLRSCLLSPTRQIWHLMEFQVGFSTRYGYTSSVGLHKVAVVTAEDCDRSTYKGHVVVVAGCAF